MTKKDYGEIARIIRENHESHKVENEGALGEAQNAFLDDLLGDLAYDLSSYFERDNPRFDRDRFAIATGLGREVI